MPSVPHSLHRRVFLRFVAASLVVAHAPGCSDKPVDVPVSTPFFTDAERRALGALADHVFPPDSLPGANALGVGAYIERTLTALDSDASGLWAGGPYSGRKAFPDAMGAPGSMFPENSFMQFLTLDRVAEKGLRLWLYGSAGVAGGGPNDGLLGPIVGVRDVIRDALRDAIASAKTPIETLDEAGLAAIYDGMPIEFRKAFVELVCEGLFSAPEYGGNKDGGGWAIAHFEGDSLPLGYSSFDAANNTWKERADQPVSKKDPGPDPDPLTPDVMTLLDSLVSLAQGKKFP